jgi:LysR family transcriptional regulator, glycine cleavage system transcriptional activator
MVMRLPSFRSLLGFEAAARLGNYSRAAEELCISQSAISHQMLQLEQQLGQPLFRRKGRGVELTVAGRLLLESVTRSLEHIRGGLSRLETYMDPNLVTLVCPAGIAHGWLQSRIDALRTEHPELCPIISIDETARYIDEMDVDIAITRQPLRQSGVLETPLFEDALWALCTPEVAAPSTRRMRRSAPQRPRTGLLCLETDLTSEHIGPHIRTHFGGMRKVAIYDDPRLVLDAALRGRGVALLSSLLAHESLRRNQLVRWGPDVSLSLGTVWMSRSEGESRSPLVRGVFDSLLRSATQG